MIRNLMVVLIFISQNVNEVGLLFARLLTRAFPRLRAPVQVTCPFPACLSHLQRLAQVLKFSLRLDTDLSPIVLVRISSPTLWLLFLLYFNMIFFYFYVVKFIHFSLYHLYILHIILKMLCPQA